MDEGYIKFKANWTKTAPLTDPLIDALNISRKEMYDAGFIGVYDNGIGFGNISCRIPNTDQFYISGSATGGISDLTNTHYAKVNQIDIGKNEVVCEGASIASSESMSHAIIYQSLPWVNGVIHIHHLDFWKALLYEIPTTADGATYGSPEMCHSIKSLMQTTSLPTDKIFVMKEHEEGIFTFGKDLAQAQKVLWKAFASWTRRMIGG